MASSSSSSSDDVVTIKASDERTPLLATISPIPTAEPIESSIGAAEAANGPNDDEDVPLPRLQIMLLCFTRMIEPIAFFSIFPYINSMIEKTGGIDKEDVGFYSGLIESLFSATQMCVMIFWGKVCHRLHWLLIVSDLELGRRSIREEALSRCIAVWCDCGCGSVWNEHVDCTDDSFPMHWGSIFGDNSVSLLMTELESSANWDRTVRAMITENSTKKTQAKAFSYFAFAGNLGIFLGPLLGMFLTLPGLIRLLTCDLGGALERPARKFPFLFKEGGFFDHYPYALPGFVVAFMGLVAAMIAAVFLREVGIMCRKVFT